MVVCAHGDVTEFCKNHELLILEHHDGALDEYKGSCRILVTDQEMTREEYDTQKCVLFGRGFELVSTEWTDDEVILRLLRNQIVSRKNRTGRQMFGYSRRNGLVTENPKLFAVARKVIELRDAGRSYRQIQADPEVRWPDGREIALSTLQVIVKNRDRYEK